VIRQDVQETLAEREGSVRLTSCHRLPVFTKVIFKLAKFEGSITPQTIYGHFDTRPNDVKHKDARQYVLQCRSITYSCLYSLFGLIINRIFLMGD